MSSAWYLHLGWQPPDPTRPCAVCHPVTMQQAMPAWLPHLAGTAWHAGRSKAGPALAQPPYALQPAAAHTALLVRLGFTVCCCCLAPAGAGSWLLAESLAQCEGDDVIKRALLHVHCGNTEALDWYQHRGFRVGRCVLQLLPAQWLSTATH